MGVAMLEASSPPGTLGGTPLAPKILLLLQLLLLAVEVMLQAPATTGNQLSARIDLVTAAPQPPCRHSMATLRRIFEVEVDAEAEGTVPLP